MIAFLASAVFAASRPTPSRLRAKRLACASAVSVLLLFSFASQAKEEDDPHAAHRGAMKGAVAAANTHVVLPNVTLRDAYGRPFVLKPSSFEGKVVVVDFIFTRCTTICPALTSVMASVQRGLGPRLGRDVVLVSISVDPANDTPEEMRAYAERVGANEHWRWLTGRSGDIGRVLRAFGLSAGKPNDHPPLVLVGDPARDRWIRWVGVPPPPTIVEAAEAMSRDGHGRDASRRAKENHEEH